MSGGCVSAAPTDCRVPDPTDAKADGGFGNHRAGYSPDRLAQAEHWARKGGTLAAGEGLVLCAEIDRLRDALAAVSGERDALVSLVEVLRQYYQRKANDDELYAAFCAWRENPFTGKVGA